MRLLEVRERMRRKRAWMRRQRKGTVTLDREFLKWMSFSVAGMLHPGHRHLMDSAVRLLPTSDPVLEIGAFAGLSTNVLTYFLEQHGRENELVTTDPWIFEGEEPTTVPESSVTFPEYRARVRTQFEENVRFWNAHRLPYAFDLTSDDLFTAWRDGAERTDVFGRPRRLGGPIAFSFVDGDHRYEQARRDFLHVDEFLVPGGLVLFDDSDEFGAFPDVYRVVQEAIGSHGYELVDENPHHLLRKPA
jgi:predicted O-methyltransferase YrrM